MTGGSVIKRRNITRSIKRETLEELGIELKVENAIKMARYKTDNIWTEEYLIKQDVDLNKIIMQEDEVSEVKFATFDEIEEIFKNGMFIKERWEFVREKNKRIYRKVENKSNMIFILLLFFIVKPKQE